MLDIESVFVGLMVGIACGMVLFDLLRPKKRYPSLEEFKKGSVFMNRKED